MRATQALFRRIRNFQLTTKQGPKDYYKGTGSGRMGDHTKYGGYIVNYDRVRTYCVPQNLNSFKVSRHCSYGYGVGSPDSEECMKWSMVKQSKEK